MAAHAFSQRGCVLLLTTLLLTLPFTHAQSTATGGCIQQAPSPPTSLSVEEKSNMLIITWSPPSTNECVDAYLVKLFTQGQEQPVRSSSTSGQRHTIEGLNNDQEYVVEVRAFAFKSSSGEAAKTRATPNSNCREDLKPDKVKDLRVAPDDGLVELCWSGTDNNACVDHYELSYRRDQDRRTNFRSSNTNSVKDSGCKIISKLENGVEYEFEVIAVSDKGKSAPARTSGVVGSSSGVRDSNGWSCKMIDGCQPDVTSACSMFSCTTASRLGMCGSPQMYNLNYFDRVVEQFCAEECGCDTSRPLTFQPLRGGVLDGLQESLQLSNVINTFNDALGSDSGSSGGNVFEDAQQELEEGANEFSSVVREAINNAIAEAQEDGSLLTGGVTQAVLQDAAASGVVGEAVGDFLGSTISNIVRQGINNLVNSWISSIISVIGGGLFG